MTAPMPDHGGMTYPVALKNAEARIEALEAERDDFNEVVQAAQEYLRSEEGTAVSARSITLRQSLARVAEKRKEGSK